MLRLALSLLLFPVAAEAAPQRMVFIVADAMRADVLGAYGADVPTPHLDALAARGVRFERAYSTAPWTAPSSVGMFTGDQPSTYLSGTRSDMSGQWAYHVPDSHELFAESLVDAGWDVRLKFENVNMQRSNNAQGMTPLPEPQAMTGARKQAIVQQLDFRPYNMETKRLFPPLDYLLTVPAKQSFALFIWITDPHNRYDPASPFVTMDPSGLPKPPEHYRSLIDPTTWEHPDHTLTPKELAYVKALYEGEVRSVDERIGVVMRALTQRGWLDDTLVVFTSDHGEAFGEQGLFAHGKSYYESMSRVPWLIAGPGVPSGVVVPFPVSHIDLVPTLRQLLGAGGDGPTQGSSLVPHLQATEPPRPVYLDGADKRGGWRDGVVDGAYKLIERLDGTRELYNIRRDPGEATNLVTTRADVVARMVPMLEAHRQANAALHSQRTFPSQDRASTPEELEALRALGYIE